MSRIAKAVCILALVTGVQAHLMASAHAQEAKATASKAAPVLMLAQDKPTHPEKILLTFYKLAGLAPNFQDWAAKSPFLKGVSSQDDAKVIINRESNRLSQAFSATGGDSVMVVHTSVLFDEYSTLQERLHMSEFTPLTFFSFDMYGQSVAVVPKDITHFSDIKITRAQMDEMLAMAGGGKVTAEFILKPVVADAKTPFIREGRAYWLLLAEIAELRFWSEGAQPKLLWMQRADWYKPQESSEPFGLKPAGGM